ncbi:zinc-finger domain-containing protein [Chryseobacterium sp.]|uniref:zinc-finger domain-containing protein n=1 Tax=Chryseobacterium sp. TaxID=1871047 RepID=UPI0034388DC8
MQCTLCLLSRYHRRASSDKTKENFSIGKFCTIGQPLENSGVKGSFYILMFG